MQIRLFIFLVLVTSPVLNSKTFGILMKQTQGPVIDDMVGNFNCLSNWLLMIDGGY